MGSRMETLPPGPAPTTTSSPDFRLKPRLCHSRSSLVFSPPLTNCPTAGRHTCGGRRYSTLPSVNGGLWSSTKPLFRRHHFAASPSPVTPLSLDALRQDAAPKLFQDVLSWKGKCGWKTGSCDVDSVQTSTVDLTLVLKQFNGLFPMRQCRPLCGTVDVVFRLSLGTLVAPLAKTMPISLEVAPLLNTTEETNSESGSTCKFSVTGSLKEEGNDSVGKEDHGSSVEESICHGRSLPGGNLSCNGGEVTLTCDSSEDIGIAASSDPVASHCRGISERAADDVESTGRGDDSVDDDSEDENDSEDDYDYDSCCEDSGACSEDDGFVNNSETSEDEEVALQSDVDTDSDEDDSIEDSHVLEKDSCSHLKPCLSFEKLLSEESGYCEGVVCGAEEKEAQPCWWQLPAGNADEEVDWSDDGSEDSGHELPLDEGLLTRFEDFALSPQVICTSPRPTTAAAAAAKSASSVASLQSSISCSGESLICLCSGRSEAKGTSSTPASSADCVPRHAETSASTADSVSDASNTCLASPRVQPPLLSECLQQHDATTPPSSTPAREGCYKHVHFVEGPELTSVNRMCAWSFAYRAARKGPWEQLARDRAHFRRRIESVALVLEPCLAAGKAARTKSYIGRCPLMT